MTYKKIGSVFILLIIITGSPQSQAACSLSMTTTPAPLTLGTHSSKTVFQGNITSSQSTFTINCGIVLSLTLLGTGSSLGYMANNPLVLMHTLPSSQDQIPYQIASNTLFSPAISTQGASLGGGGDFSLLSLALLSQQNMSIPVFIRTLPTTLWPRSGQYIGTQALIVTGTICTVNLLGACLGFETVSGSVSMDMQLQVNKSCEFQAVTTDVSFGEHAFLNNIPDQVLTVRLQCTHQDSYKIYATQGLHFDGTHRHMDRAGQQKIAYEIYQPASTTSVLSSGNPVTRSGTGMVEEIAFPVRILSNQPTPAIGEYRDQLQVVIEY